MIRTRSEKYHSDAFNSYETEHGIHFPDAIIDAVKTLYERGDKATKTTNHSTPNIPLSEAKSMVINALKKFDATLGQKAEAILHDENRAKFKTVAPGEIKTQHCLQAGVKKEHLQKRGMLDETSSHSVSDIINDNPHAVIHMDYDGTINSVLYLAHELGHAIADDFQISRGNNFASNPVHMEEVQAYLIQNIVRIELETSDDPNIVQATKAQYAQEFQQYKSYYSAASGDNDAVLHGRPPAFTLGASIAQHLTDNPDLRAFGSQVILGCYGPADIGKSLAAIDIEKIEPMQKMLAKAVPSPQNNSYNHELTPKNEPPPPPQ